MLCARRKQAKEYKLQGSVKWFSQEKGYGFITSERGEDHYFNVQSVQGANLPSNGDKVSFDSKPGNKGPRAFNVSIVSKATQASSRHNDDRINCPSCGKKIVPRMITYRGEPEKSVCPYCAATVKKFSSCFIATAVYGDPSCPEVRELRRFRDERLLPNPFGKAFVAFYYFLSPPVAGWLENKRKLSAILKSGLNIIVQHITSKGSGR